MKKAFLALAVTALLIGCNSAGEGEFVLNGKVSGVDGKNIILKKQDDSLGPINVDTVKIVDGKFEFKGKVAETEMFGLQIENDRNISPFIGEAGEIEIEIVKDSISQNKLSGTFNNENFAEYAKVSAKLTQKLAEEWKKDQPAFLLAQNSKDTAKIREIRVKMEGLQAEVNNGIKKWARENPKAFVSVFIIGNGLRVFEPDIEEIETMFNNLDPEVKKTKSAKALANQIKQFKQVEVGRRAPEFSAKTPDGKEVSLKESRGKVTLIDFWASWCGPCRKANPELVTLYKELHPKGLNIIGVSLDKPGQADRWKEAIAKDGLAWTQISNLKEWEDPIAMRYGVKAIPSSFVVNQYGIIVAKDLHGEELKKKINEWLAKPDVPK